MGSIVLFLAIEKSYVTLKCNSHFRIRNGKIELVMRMVTRTTKSNEPAFFNGAKNSLLSPTNFKKCNLSQISVRTDFCIAIGWYIGWPIIGFAGIENAYRFWPIWMPISIVLPMYYMYQKVGLSISFVHSTQLKTTYSDTRSLFSVLGQESAEIVPKFPVPCASPLFSPVGCLCLSLYHTDE